LEIRNNRGAFQFRNLPVRAGSGRTVQEQASSVDTPLTQRGISVRRPFRSPTHEQPRRRRIIGDTEPSGDLIDAALATAAGLAPDRSAFGNPSASQLSNGRIRTLLLANQAARAGQRTQRGA
jgi:hypothetical protein